MKTRQVYVKPKGQEQAAWHPRPVSNDGFTRLYESDNCCDCDQAAATITFAGFAPGRNGRPILWAQCENCAGETKAANADAKRQAEYECER